MACSYDAGTGHKWLQAEQVRGSLPIFSLSGTKFLELREHGFSPNIAAVNCARVASVQRIVDCKFPFFFFFFLFVFH
jgi:hypothetical protein